MERFTAEVADRDDLVVADAVVDDVLDDRGEVLIAGLVDLEVQVIRRAALRVPDQQVHDPPAGRQLEQRPHQRRNERRLVERPAVGGDPAQEHLDGAPP